jgi:DNA-binding LacI/PurR family transcriptional regulator
LCERLIRHNIDGVFFAPLIINDNSINSTVANKMKQAGIGVVLLDRCVCNYPNRSEFDLVSMDNVNAGYIATKHLLSLGCKKIHFLTHKKYVSTSNERIVGYRAALAEEGISTDGLPVIKVSPFDRDEVQNAYQVHKPQALVIIDDESASNVMNFLLEIGVKIPEELRIVSFDDLYYSKDLPVPLTTIRQPTQEIGALATNLMLQRLENAKMRSRKLTITGELIIRESCGARL